MDDREYTFDDFRKELVEAETLGTEAARKAAVAGLDRWKTDYASLAKAAALFMERIVQNGNDRKEEETAKLAEIYLPLLQAVHDDYAKKNLSWEDYKDFVHDMDEGIARVEHRA